MRTAGMTTIELLVTIILAAVLMAIGVPAFQSMMANNRATSFAGDYISYLNLARSEAIKRGRPVSFCAAANTSQTACAAGGCTPVSGNGNCWSNGWIVFVDNDSNGMLASQDDRIKVNDALTGNQTVSNNNVVITYSPEGFVSSGAGN